jgi:hypothetical protein
MVDVRTTVEAGRVCVIACWTSEQNPACACNPATIYSLLSSVGAGLGVNM